MKFKNYINEADVINLGTYRRIKQRKEMTGAVRDFADDVIKQNDKCISEYDKALNNMNRDLKKIKFPGLDRSLDVILSFIVDITKICTSKQYYEKLDIKIQKKINTLHTNKKQILDILKKNLKIFSSLSDKWIKLRGAGPKIQCIEFIDQELDFLKYAHEKFTDFFIQLDKILK